MYDEIKDTKINKAQNKETIESQLEEEDEEEYIEQDTKTYVNDTKFIDIIKYYRYYI